MIASTNGEEYMLNSTVKWTATDEQGEFSHVGKCIAVVGEMVTMSTLCGEMTVPANEVKKTREARTNHTAQDQQAEAVDVYVPTTVRPGSKAAQAVELIRTILSAGRQESIALLMAELGMSQAGASTYNSNARKYIAATPA
jgi:hypothetical protein